MGCDIHIFVEKKQDDKWVVVKGVNEDNIKMYKEFIKQDKKTGNGHNLYWENILKEEMKPHYYNWIYDARNYTLFSILADVRNGIDSFNDEPKTGHYVKPISEPKGLPEDVSEVVKDYFSDEWLHSLSYLTLKEIDNYIREANIVKYSGLVGAEGYKEFEEKGSPSSWSGGSNTKIISNEEMQQYIDGKISFKETFIQTLVQWEEPVTDTISLLDIRHEMAKLGNGNEENVRIVFGFDN